MNINCLDGKWIKLGAVIMGMAGCFMLAGNSQVGPDQIQGRAIAEVGASSKVKNVRLKEEVVRYQKDSQYMALNRQLLPEYPQQKRVAKKQNDIADTVQVRDKPLILGGRGLEIKSFEAQSYIKLEFDYYHHLQKHYPIPVPMVVEDKIDPRVKIDKNTKNYIYHPTRQALNRLKQVDMQEPEPPEKMVPLKKIPETYLRVPRMRPTQLILYRSDKALDLLYGNESVNRDAYKNW